VPVSLQRPAAPVSIAKPADLPLEPSLSLPSLTSLAQPSLSTLEFPAESLTPLLPALSPLIEIPLPSLTLLLEPRLPSLALMLEPPPVVLPALAPLIDVALPSLNFLIEFPLQSSTLLPERSEPSLVALDFLISPPLRSLALLIEPPARVPSVCIAKTSVFGFPAKTQSIIPPSDAEGFGLALSRAALAQLSDLVIYNPRYVRIAYPMGDVSPLFGVCTDVVVRAYRALGIDLQALIQQTRSGTGDRNIDHRRVEVVRRFLVRHAEVLPVTDLAEDYAPGDIVTYYRPQNRTTTAHIAIVTDQLAASGRPMVVHNRGWGPQLEDALFVDKITGHFRFSGLSTGLQRVAPASQRRMLKQAVNDRERRAQLVRE